MARTLFSRLMLVFATSIILPFTVVAQNTVGLARVNQVPAINGGATVEGSIHMMSGGAINLNGGATITGDLLVPGTPIIRLNGGPTYGGTQEGTGPTTPSNYTVTLNGGSSLGHVVRRTAPVALAPVPAPPTPVGTRSVNLNNANDPIGSWTTLRTLTLNGNVGQITVPAGTYGNFSANGGSGFTLGVAGATQPSIYNFQSLNLNGQAQLVVLGPVVINLKNGFSANGQVGSTSQPAWLTLNINSGSINLNGGGLLRLTIGGINPTPTLVFTPASIPTPSSTLASTVRRLA